MRKLAFLVALPVVGALIGIAPTAATAQPTPEVTAFCDAGLAADKASTKVFEAKKPKQKDVQALEAALASAESTAPPEIATNVQTVAREIQNALETRKEPSEATLQQNLSAIDQYRYNSCGYEQADATGIEYEFQGLPKTLQPGTVAFKLTNTGAELHELALFRLKGKESAKKVAGLHEAEFEKKVVGETEAAQNETSYLFATLEPGRYGAACHLRVGSTSERAANKAKGKHHWERGMIAEITVT
jgi:hypothetical protein